MNNLFKRTIFGVVYVGIIIFSILYSKISFILLFWMLMNLSIYEFNKLIKLQSVYPFILGNLLFAFVIVLKLKDVYSQSLSENMGLALLFGVFFTFIPMLFSKNEVAVTQLGKIFLSVVYIALPFNLIVMIPFINNESRYVNTSILGVFILVWINDTFAYIVGSQLGKHKILPRISPGKSWEGYFGGMFFTFLAAYLLSIYFIKLSLNHWMVFALIVSTIGVLGDLIESMFKRQAGVKDSGNIIPGHGGILDRLDSVIFAAPFIFMYLSVTLN